MARTVCTLVAGALLMGLAGCADRPAAVVSAPVTDPYRDTGDGGAVYDRDLNSRGVATIRVLPGTPTSQEFQGVAGDTVTFAADQAALGPEAVAVVARQAAWLLKNPGFTAVVEGHADDPGTGEYNLALAARRAAAVQEMLIARGVPAERVTTVGYGRERPLAACAPADLACVARNRRAVTVVAPGLSG